MKYKMMDRVARVEQRFVRQWVRGVGKDAEFTDDGQGWWLKLETMPTSMYLGEEKPGLKEGDRVALTVEKV